MTTDPQMLKDDLNVFAAQNLRRVCDEYQDFAAHDPGADAKAFSAHHSACKTALAHLEALLKLVKFAEEPAVLPASPEAARQGLDALILQARSGLAQLNQTRDQETMCDQEHRHKPSCPNPGDVRSPQ